MTKLLDEQVRATEPAGQEHVKLVARALQVFGVHGTEFGELRDRRHQLVEAIAEFSDDRLATDLLVGCCSTFHLFRFSLSDQEGRFLRAPAPPLLNAVGLTPGRPGRACSPRRIGPPFLRCAVLSGWPQVLPGTPAGCQAGISCFLPLPIKSARPISL